MSKPESWFAGPDAKQVAANILSFQSKLGGWPKNVDTAARPATPGEPLPPTFDNGATTNELRFLARLYQASPDETYRQAFDLGLDCILKCQVRVNGKLTAWCAQHDEIDCSPRPARAFELVSLSGSESVGIVRVLMSLEHPDAATLSAIAGAVAWFESVKITGHKLITVADKNSPGGQDRRLVEEPDAPPLWARFYEIGTNRPIFCDRDGVVKYQLSEIGHERRNGYSWLGDWPRKLLENEYPLWKRSIGETRRDE